MRKVYHRYVIHEAELMDQTIYLSLNKNFKNRISISLLGETKEDINSIMDGINLLLLREVPAKVNPSEDSNYYDFSHQIVWKWIWQSIIYKDVLFYRDKKQKCWCRKIVNVKGYIEDGNYFIPEHRLVKYKQIIDVKKHNEINKK